VAWPHASAAEILRGNARVVDGDSMVADGPRIHILDIEAPEDAQLRFTKAQAVAHSARRCGLQAAHVLSDWISQTVTCDTMGRGSRKAWLARCAVAGEDAEEWLAAKAGPCLDLRCKCEVVRNATDTAKAAQIGIWSSNFTMPWAWRKAH